MSEVMTVVTAASSGSFDETVLSQVSRVLDEAGHKVRIHRLGRSSDSDGPLETALETPVGTLVIAGGDGTIHHVLSDLDAMGSLSPAEPIGLLPMGTGNDMARGLGLPLDPVDAARVLLDCRPRPMDVLVDGDGGLVVNAAHAGAGAEASERGQAFKPVLGALGYAIGAALAGMRRSGWPIRVDVDGRTLTSTEGELLMVGLAVGRTIGGGTPLAPEADPGDGLADVVVVSATGPLERADFARRLRQGTQEERDDVLVARGSRVTVDGGQAPLNVDGELLGPVGTRTWTVRPGAWSVLVPAAG